MECNKARSAFVNGMSAALSVVGFGRASPEELGFDPKVLEKHKQRIKTHQENGVFTGFAEGALSDGKIVFLNLCGFTDKTKKHRMTERTLFRGYSMMKPITATAFMSLVDDGMLKLDDPVHKFIPKFKFLRVKRGKKTEPLRKTMTLRHLLMHTSGIGYGPGAITPGVPLVARSPEEKLYKAVAVKQETGEVDSLEKLCEELCSLPLLFQPGADYTYGMSLDVLGYVMQLVTGQPLRKIIQTRVLEPVGMRDSCFLVPQSKLHQLSTYYRLMRDPVKGNRWLERLDGLKAKDSMYAKGSQAVYRSGGLPAGVPAAGGLWGAGRSTMLFLLRDILLYCQMLLNGGQSLAGHRVLKASTASSLQMDWLRLKEACRTRNPPGWGSPDVGWSPLGNVERYGPHAGALYMGGMSYFWLDPRRKVAAAIMTESYWQVNPLGWKADLDDLEQVIQSAMKGTSSKRQAESQDGSLAKLLKC